MAKNLVISADYLIRAGLCLYTCRYIYKCEGVDRYLNGMYSSMFLSNLRK